MAAGDLTTLQALKDWLSITEPTDDALLARLITGGSSFLMQLMNRDVILSAIYTGESYDGHNGTRLLLLHTPITAVSAVTVNGVSIPVATSTTGAGFLFDSISVMLRGFIFTRGYKNIAVTYTGGVVAVPKDLEIICLELLGSKYKGRERIGVASKGLAQETISFRDTDLNRESKQVLASYKRVVPL